MRSEFVERECMETVLRLLLPSNRLAMRLCMETGLRVGDVLAIRRDKLAQRMTVYESKTGKTRRVYIGRALLADLNAMERNGPWLFPGRDPEKHRTRQAVFCDLRRAAKACRLPMHLTPHSARKLYAVEQFRRCGDLERVQRLLNHSDSAVTLLYVMADQLARQKDRYKKTSATKR